MEAFALGDFDFHDDGLGLVDEAVPRTRSRKPEMRAPAMPRAAKPEEPCGRGTKTKTMVASATPRAMRMAVRRVARLWVEWRRWREGP